MNVLDDIASRTRLACAIGAMIALFAASKGFAQPAAPDAAARQWLFYVDGGDYAKGWDRAGRPFKAAMTAPLLESKIAPVREPLGAILERRLFKVTYANTAPGLPEGNYAAVQFSSRFANKAEVGETIWVDFENSRWEKSHWAVIGYFIGPDGSKASLPAAQITGSAMGTRNCSHDEQVQARIARMNGYIGGPRCNLPE